MGTGIAALLVSGSYPVVLAMIGVLAAGAALVIPNLSAMVAAGADVNTGLALGWKSSAGSLGQFLGPLVGGSLIGWQAHLPFLMAGALLLTVAVGVGLVPRRRRVRARFVPPVTEVSRRDAPPCLFGLVTPAPQPADAFEVGLEDEDVIGPRELRDLGVDAAFPGRRLAPGGGITVVQDAERHADGEADTGEHHDVGLAAALDDRDPGPVVVTAERGEHVWEGELLGPAFHQHGGVRQEDFAALGVELAHDPERLAGGKRSRLVDLGAGGRIARDEDQLLPCRARVPPPCSPPKRAGLVRAARRVPLRERRGRPTPARWREAEALAEIHRVLRPGGALHFVEHGRAPDPKVARWQDRLTPIQRRVAGGCHLNRPIDTLISGAGLELARLDNFYMRGPKASGYMFEGVATKA